MWRGAPACTSLHEWGAKGGAGRARCSPAESVQSASTRAWLTGLSVVAHARISASAALDRTRRSVPSQQLFSENEGFRQGLTERKVQGWSNYAETSQFTMIYKQLIPSGTTRFHIFFQHAHDTRFTCRRTCACCMLTTHAKTYSVLSIGSRRPYVPVTAAALELMMSCCGSQTVAASTTRA